MKTILDKTMDIGNLFKIRFSDLLGTVLLCLFYLSLVFSFIYEHYDIYFKILCSTLSFCCAVFVCVRNRGVRVDIVLFYIFLLILLTLSFMNGNVNNKEVGYFIIYAPILAMLLTLRLDISVTRIYIYLLALIFSVFLFYFPINVSKDYFLNAKSGIFLNMLVACNLYYIASSQNNYKISIFPVFITCILAIWSTSRGGVMTSAALLLGLFFLTNAKNKVVWCVILLSSIYLILIHIAYLSENQLIWFYKSGVELSGREMAWSAYFDSFQGNLKNFLFGVPLNVLPSIFDTNVHSSYFKLHSNFGILGIISVFLLLLFFSMNIKKVNKIHVLLFVAILARIATDTPAFNGYLDPFIYFYIFRYIHLKWSKAELGSKNLWRA